MLLFLPFLEEPDFFRLSLFLSSAQLAMNLTDILLKKLDSIMDILSRFLFTAVSSA